MTHPQIKQIDALKSICFKPSSIWICAVAVDTYHAIAVATHTIVQHGMNGAIHTRSHIFLKDRLR